MKQNLGKSDRLMRAVIGVILLVFGVISQSGLLLIFGLFCLYEAIASWCVLYQLTGKNSCPLPSDKRASIPVKRTLFVGISILVGAIFMNFFAGLVGWKTWYDLLTQRDYGLSLDNYLFLLLVYPFTLGFIAQGASRYNEWPFHKNDDKVKERSN